MRFSIGIPAFKPHFFKETISSVLAQNFTDFELIIINDHSPYDLKSIVNTFQDSRIKYYENSANFGAENVVDNWNKCLSYATGDYFILLGDDDIIENTCLSEFDNLINKFPNVRVYHCRSKIIDETGNILFLTEPRPEFESVYDLINQRIKNQRIQFISDFVFKTSSLKTSGGFYKLPLAWFSDDITVYIAAGEEGIVNTNLPLFNYRTSNHTITSTGSVKLKLVSLKNAIEWIKTFVYTNNAISLTDKILRNEIISALDPYYLNQRANILAFEYKSKTWITLLKNLTIEKKKFINVKELFKSFLIYYFRHK